MTVVSGIGLSGMLPAKEQLQEKRMGPGPWSAVAWDSLKPAYNQNFLDLQISGTSEVQEVLVVVGLQSLKPYKGLLERMLGFPFWVDVRQV